MFDIITIGTATGDTFITSNSYKTIKDKKVLKKIGFEVGQGICFELGSKIEIDAPIFTTGGGASNTAITFAKMGLSAATFTKIGNDPTGHSIIEELKKNGVVSYYSTDKKLETGSSIILLSSTGERTILVYRGAGEYISINEIPLGKMQSRWAYIVPGKIHFPALKNLVNELYNNGTNIALNPSKSLIQLGLDKIIPILKKTKVLILNREEASYLTGIAYSKKEEIFKKLDALVDGILVITDGAGGAYVSDNSIVYHAGIFKDKKAVDRTGAGDAFGSAFVGSLIAQNEECKKGLCDMNKIEYAIRRASANSTSVIEYIGAKKGILTNEQFEKNQRWKKLPIKITKVIN